MRAYMFPGQGAQARGMGGGLFDEFAELTTRADEILGYSIKELCLRDPHRVLNQTSFTQPALYVVNALAYYKTIEQTGKQPDFVAGHSLGEFNALLAARCFDFATGLELVKKRAELMSQVTDGAMAAIVNATRAQVEAQLQANRLDQIDIANHNTPLQVVVSGPLDEITACQGIFQVKYVRLNTSGPFHSRLMQPAREKFASFLQAYTFAEPTLPVIANVTARPYQGDMLAECLSKQMCSTVLWSDTLRYLMNVAADMEFIEVGHGDVLTKMMAKFKAQIATSAD